MHERVRSRVLQLDVPMLELRASDWNNRPHEQPVENGANFLGWQRAGGSIIRGQQKLPRGHALRMLLCIAQNVPLLLQERVEGGRHEESSSGKQAQRVPLRSVSGGECGSYCAKSASIL